MRSMRTRGQRRRRRHWGRARHRIHTGRDLWWRSWRGSRSRRDSRSRMRSGAVLGKNSFHIPFELETETEHENNRLEMIK